MTSRFLELLLAAILEGTQRGAGRLIQNRSYYLDHLTFEGRWGSVVDDLVKA